MNYETEPEFANELLPGVPFYVIVIDTAIEKAPSFSHETVVWQIR